MKDSNQKINAVRDEQNDAGRTVLSVKGFAYVKKLAAKEPTRSSSRTPKRVGKSTKGTPTSQKATSGTPANVSSEGQILSTPKNSRRSTNAVRSSTGKRKSAAARMIGVDDDDSEDDYCPETPSKRSRSGQKSGLNATHLDWTSPLPKSHQRRQVRGASSNMQDNLSSSQNDNAQDDLFRDRQIGVVEEPQNLRTASPSQVKATRVITQNPSGSPSPLDVAPGADGSIGTEPYKKIICGLLKIDYDLFCSLSLYDLRVYARPYNVKLENRHWLYPGLDKFRFRGISAFMNSTGSKIDHFAHVIQKFIPLAVARGDLMPDGTRILSLEKKSYNVDEDYAMQQALGLRPNPFGILD